MQQALVVDAMVCRHNEVVKLCTRIKATYTQLSPAATPSRASITVQALHVMNLVALSRATEAEPLARECLAQVAQLPGERMDSQVRGWAQACFFVHEE
jgi:hypothetical protein